MDTLEALLLGLVQGLTEYLPVSSSGHLAIGANLLHIEAEENLLFTIVVHVATVLSTLCVLWHEIYALLKGACSPLLPADACARDGKKCCPLSRLNPDQRYVLAIGVSMIPIGVVGVFFKDAVEEIFGQGLLIVGICLLLTAALLAFSYYAHPRTKENIGYRDAFVIGLAQACAVLPGLSRSGSTIATGLLLGCKKERMAQFSFLMVIPPILGEALLDGLKLAKGEDLGAEIGFWPLLVGFLAAFLSGCAACKWMIALVRRGKLVYFAIYCALVGAALLIAQMF